MFRTVDVKIPWSMLLYVIIVVGGWGYPSSVNFVMIWTATFTLPKIPIVSASAVENIILRIVQLSIRMRPLGFGSSIFDPCGILLLN